MNTGYVLAAHEASSGAQKYVTVQAGIKLRVHGTAYKQQRGSLER
jgi:hypothetical protein